MTVAATDGRVGDVWLLRGGDYDVVVSGLTRHTISVKPAGEPEQSASAFDLDSWQDSLYQLREDVSSLAVGDPAHLYVPPTTLYVLQVTIDTRWPSLSGWFGYQAGRLATPYFEDTGLFLNPSIDDRLTTTRLFRPYAMLAEGDVVVDAEGRSWRYEPAFRFVTDDSVRGLPQWPLLVVSDEAATVLINETSHAEQVERWVQHAQVDPEVFDRSLDHDDYNLNDYLPDDFPPN